MEFIKTCWGVDGSYMVSIRTNCYCSTLAHVQNMVAVLKRDHPEQEISNEDITIVIYNTDSFKGIMGVEWNTKNPNRTYFELDVAPCIF